MKKIIYTFAILLSTLFICCQPEPTPPTGENPNPEEQPGQQPEEEPVVISQLSGKIIGTRYSVDYSTSQKSESVNTKDNVTTYVYSHTNTDPYIPGKSVDLTSITVTLTVNADGSQTVAMHVPSSTLPIYTPQVLAVTEGEETSFQVQYYYEQLPVRLIYQVGLTQESENRVRTWFARLPLFV